MNWPLIPEDPGLASQLTALATSSEVTKAFMGVSFSIFAICAWLRFALVIGVSTTPGSTAFIDKPCGE
jgi:hypothetical protein